MRDSDLEKALRRIVALEDELAAARDAITKLREELVDATRLRLDAEVRERLARHEAEAARVVANHQAEADAARLAAELRVKDAELAVLRAELVARGG